METEIKKANSLEELEKIIEKVELNENVDLFRAAHVGDKIKLESLEGTYAGEHVINRSLYVMPGNAGNLFPGYERVPLVLEEIENESSIRGTYLSGKIKKPEFFGFLSEKGKDKNFEMYNAILEAGKK